MNKVLAGSVLLALTFSAHAATDNPWTGHWVLDKSRSHFTGSTMTYSQGPHGLLHISDGANTEYDFGLDGKEYPSAYGRTTTWTAAGKDAWDQVTKADGKVLTKSHRVLSADGKTMTITYTGTRPDGVAFKEQDVYARAGGTSGLIGKWRSTKVEENAPESFIISAPSAGVMRYEVPEQKAATEGATDGTDLPLNGPDLPAGMTIGFKPEGSAKMHYTIKINGKPDSYGIETLAADRKSFTDVSWNAGKDSEKQTAVYIKQ